MRNNITLVACDMQKRNLQAIGLLIFLLSVGEGMTAPAIPLLGEALGSSYSFIGFFMTGFSFSYGLMTLVSGRLSDHWGRKRILIGSIVACFLASLGYCISQSSGSLLIFRTVEGLGRGALWVAAEAILADNTSVENRSSATGWFTGAYGIGAMIGSLTGGVMMQYFDFKAVFLFYPVLSVLSVGAAWIGIIEVPVKKIQEHSLSDKRGLLKEVKVILPICYVFFTYTGFLYSIWGLLSVVASHYKVDYLGIGVIFALFWLCRVVSFIGTGKAEKIYGRKQVLMGGIILLSMSTAIFILAANFWFLIIAAILGGVGTGIMFILCVVIVADSASPGYKGFAMGAMEFSGSVGMVVQTALSGIVGQYGGIRLTYLFTLIACLIGVVVVKLFINTPKRIAPNKEDSFQLIRSLIFL